MAGRTAEEEVRTTSGRRRAAKRLIAAIWVVVCAASLAIRGQPTGEPAPVETQRELARILERLANVAELYLDNVLRFTCDETIHFTGRGAPVVHRFQYLYRYSEDDASLRDFRRTRSGKTALGSLAGFGLPAYLERAYSWVFIFLREVQPRYRFRLDGEDDVLGRPGHRVSFAAIPPYEPGVNDWFGTAWVDRDGYQLLVVEAWRLDDRHARRLIEREATVERGEGKASFETSIYRTEFDMVKNGMRFPGRVTIERTAHRFQGGSTRARVVPLWRVDQIYKRYRFFGVRTEQEIQRLVQRSE
ncbi:MAG TPA: hypothetical protein VD788_11410 [Candidatus Polarisedimenticolaceae bacterium]|nr:hypothetical protein [Candidatus Polarisedimenticolaceae bacterium]